MKRGSGSKKNLCGVASFRDADGRFKPGTHWRPHARFREAKYLRDEYLGHKKSASEIASDNGVTENAIFFWLCKHKIPRRTVSQVRAIKHWGASGPNNPMFGRCGSKHPNWINGATPERQRVYAQSFWRELVKHVYKRDGYRCARCGKGHTRENKLHAHHVKPWGSHPESRLDLENLVTVCNKCHWWIHSNENKDHAFLSS